MGTRCSTYFPGVACEAKVTANTVDIHPNKWVATDDHMGDVAATYPIVPGTRVVLGLEAS